METMNNLSIAVLIPCFNEEEAIGTVVSDFKAAIPGASIYAYDNNSNDNTIEVARKAGALIGSESKQGKGNVVRRMFADIEADIYVLVDGDDTYDASSINSAISLLVENNLDMINISREETGQAAYRRGHRFGNAMLTNIVRMIFGRHIKDMLSGYRVFSRRYVKTFPTSSSGFEIETELTVHALELDMPITEMKAPYKERPEGSFSKLSTYKDGIRILKTIGRLVKDERPMLTFLSISAVFFLLSIWLGFGIIIEFMQTGLVPRLPTAVLSVGLMLLSSLSLACGMILDTVTQGRRETKRLFYLNQSYMNKKS